MNQTDKDALSLVIEVARTESSARRQKLMTFGRSDHGSK